jgi:hypothetical protein
MRLLKIAASRSNQSVSDYVETRLAPHLDRIREGEERASAKPLPETGNFNSTPEVTAEFTAEELTNLLTQPDDDDDAGPSGGGVCML